MSKNILPSLDIISPKITLFYDGDKRYSTTIGGIFTIIIFLIGILEFFNQLFSYINFDVNNILYYRKYLNEFGSYKLNIDKNSLFFYINFIENINHSQNYLINFDFSKIRLVGLFNSEIKLTEESFFNQEHWLLGNCSSLNINKELQKLSGNNFNKSICIKYFYNKKTKQYYSINDKNFQTPSISNSSEYFSIYTHKCINNSLINQIFGNCSSENEIIDYISNTSLTMEYHFLTHQVNSDNHKKNTFKLAINSITSKVQMKDTYISNSVTFTPVIIEKNKRVFFTNTNIDQVFSYQDYHKSSEGNTRKKDILNLFSITFENLGHYYQYSYKTIYDIFEKVTILTQVAHYILFIINYIYNLFIGNIVIQNIIFHQKLPYTRKIRNLFSDNYEFNLKNGYFKNNNIINNNCKKSKLDYKNILFNNMSSKSKSNKILPKDSGMMLNQNISNAGQLNNRNEISIKTIGAYKNDYTYDEEKIFGKIKFSIKDIIFYFKYLIFNKWNNSPLLLFDSIQKKLISVEHLFRIHLLLLTLKKQRRKTNMIDIYKFFYE